LLQFAIFKGVEMKNLILIIGDEIRVNRPFLNYIFEIYENKFGVLDDVIFVRNKDTNLAEILEHFIANRRNLTIFCAPSSFAVVSQILASLCDDSIELTNGLLSPTTAICAQKGTILMKIKECIINLIQADPLMQIPPILMDKDGERKNFYIIDFEPDLIRSAMEKICIKFGIFIQISPVCKYVVQVRAKTGEFGNLNGFLKEIAIKFDNLVIFDANLAQFLVNKLRQLDMRVTFAESCTGGLAAARLCEISGASDVFSGSFITYANELKTQILGVREEILRDAVAWAVGTVSASEIDEINILNASILAMHRALDGLKVRPAFILVDGNRFKPYGATPFATIVKGDAKYLSIAAASILAKTFRDDEMRRLHEQYPWYGWDHNAGYPTREHRRGIEQHGLTPYHRRSFHLLPDCGPQLPFPED